MKEEEKEAERIIEIYKPLALFWQHDLTTDSVMKQEQYDNAVNCAVIHVEGIIKEKETFEPYGERTAYWQRVLKILNNK